MLKGVRLLLILMTMMIAVSISAYAIVWNGTPSDDNYSGTSNGDTIYGFGGPDHLRGEGGDDIIWGGDENDTLEGGDGNDKLYGEGGDGDSLYGGPGNDILDPGTGGGNMLDGGDGDDTFIYKKGYGNVSNMYGQAGNDTLIIEGYEQWEIDYSNLHDDDGGPGYRWGGRIKFADGKELNINGIEFAIPEQFPGKMPRPNAGIGIDKIPVTYSALTVFPAVQYYEVGYSKEVAATTDTAVRANKVSTTALSVNLLTTSHNIELYSTYYISTRAVNAKGASPRWSDETTGAAISNRIDLIEAEWYDLGGQGQGYNDDSARDTGSTYRPNDTVDIKEGSGASWNRSVTAKAGEWLRYTRTLDITQAGFYSIKVTAKSAGDNNRFRFLLAPPGGSVQNVENTETLFNALASWTAIDVGNIYLTSGTNQIFLRAVEGEFDIDKIEMVRVTPEKNTLPDFQTIIYPITNTYGIEFYEIDSITEKRLTAIPYVAEKRLGTHRKIRSINMSDIEAFINNTTAAYTGVLQWTYETFYKLWKTTNNHDATALIIKKPITAGKSTIYKSLGLAAREKLVSFHYEGKINNVTKEEDGDKVVFKWEESSSSKTGEYLTKDRMIFRISKKEAYNTYNYSIAEEAGTYSVSIPKYYYDLYNKSNELNKIIASNADDQVQKFLKTTPGTITAEAVKYIDLVYGEAGSIVGNNISFQYSEGSFSVIGLPVGDYTLQIYSIKSDFDGKFKVINYEHWDDFESDIPSVFTDPLYKNDNNFFLIDNIDKSKWGTDGTIEVNFLTKTTQDIVKTSFTAIDCVYPITAPGYPTPTSAAVRLQEWNKQLNQYKDVKEAAASPITLRPSDLLDFKYPVDIVLCIDTSGSMQDEIVAVKNKLPEMTQKFIQRGYAARYNIITFGPNTTATQGGYSPIFKNTFDEAQRGSTPTNASSPTRGGGAMQSRYTLKQYRERWFGVNNTVGYDTTTPAALLADVAEIQSALSVMTATGGYGPPTGYSGRQQENGHSAILKAIELLDKNGRSLSADRKILKTSSGGIEPSVKWIILITDENLSLENFNPANDSGNNGTAAQALFNSVKNAMDGKGIDLNIICHVKTPTGVGLPAARNNDDIGQVAEASNDAGGPYYPVLKQYLGNMVSFYELGNSTGTKLNKSLDAITDKIGVMSRWVLSYKTPFNDKDGTVRQVNFGLRNVPLVTTKIAILKDVNYVDGSTTNTIASSGTGKNIKLREYSAEKIAVELEPKNPINTIPDNVNDTTIIRPVFKVIGNDVEITAYARSTKMLGGVLLEDPITEARVTVAKFDGTQTGFNASAVVADLTQLNSFGSDSYVKKLVAGLAGMDSEDTARIDAKWYKIRALIPKSTFSIPGAFYDVRLFAKTDSKYISEVVKKVAMPSVPPKLTGVVVENTTLRTFLESVKGRGGTPLFNTDTALRASTLSYSAVAFDGFQNNIAEFNIANRVSTPLAMSQAPGYTGEFSKNGDRLRVTINFTAEEFNTATYTGDYLTVGEKNVAAINFGNVYIKADSVTLIGTSSKPRTQGATTNVVVKEYRAVWDNLTANLGDTGIKNMTVGLIDNNGTDINSITVGNNEVQVPMTKYLKDAPATDVKVDNTSVSSPTTGINNGTDYYTKDPSVGLNYSTTNANNTLNRTLQGDGTLLVKVKYKWDWSKSDNTPQNIQNHINASTNKSDNLNAAGEGYYYTTSTALALLTTKPAQPGGTTSYDDGVYSNVEFTVFDRAGYESSGSTALGKNIYIDKIAPRISNVRLQKIRGVNNPPIVDSRFYIENDEILVYYSVSDYNIPDDGDMKYFRQMSLTGTTTVYSKYDTLVSSGHNPWVVKELGTSTETTGSGINVFKLVGGAKGSPNTTVAAVKITDISGENKFELGAIDRAGNVSDIVEKEVEIDRGIPTITGGAFIIPIEILRCIPTTTVSVISYVDNSGTPVNLQATYSIAGATTMQAFDWSGLLIPLNIEDNHKSGTTAYTRSKQAFVTIGAIPSGVEYYEIRYRDNGGNLNTMLVHKNAFENNSIRRGLFLPDNIFKNDSATQVDYIGSIGLGSEKKLEIIGWDLAGNRTEPNAGDLMNGLLKDSIINGPSNQAIKSPNTNTNQVTLNVINNQIQVILDLGLVRDNIGLASFSVRFRDERGNNVSNGFKVNSSNTVISYNAKVTEAAVPVNHRTLNSQFASTVTGQAFTLSFPVDQNAPFIGGKVRMEVDIYDHLGNMHTLSRDFLVQRGMNIRSQDSKTNRETTIQINQGQQGNIINRQEGGRD